MNEEQNKIPSQVPLEEQIENLKEALDYRKYEEMKEHRKIKAEAFRMAINIKPSPTMNPMGAQMAAVSFSTEDLIKSANKIYNELIK
jgi:L-lactate utilization protein LutB